MGEGKRKLERWQRLNRIWMSSKGISVASLKVVVSYWNDFKVKSDMSIVCFS